jgi:hypothetical protein
MKAPFFLLPLAVVLISYSKIFSQCAGATHAAIVQYDTTVTGIGNSSHNFSFPKFDPSLGTLLSADISSSASLAFSYTLTNNDAVNTHTYKTQIVRSDDIFSTALDPSAVDEVHQTPFVFATLAAGQHVNYGPSTLAYTINNSITDNRLINFEGVGAVSFDYEIGTSALTLLSTKYDFNFNSAVDTTTFSITYRYCTNVLLSQDLLSFNASLQSKNTALLTWQQAVVRPDRLYEVQAGTDGITFSGLASLQENATGVYSYTYVKNTATKVFFRIQEKSPSGEIKYSNIRLVEFDNDTKIPATVFPTLYTSGSLHVNFPEQGNWQLAMYAADGRKILESRQENVSSASIHPPAQLANGFYIVEVLNRQSLEKQMTRIVIQR